MAEPAAPEESEEEPKPRWRRILERIILIVLHLLFIAYFIAATVIYMRYNQNNDKCLAPPEENTTSADTGTTIDGPTAVPPAGEAPPADGAAPPVPTVPPTTTEGETESTTPEPKPKFVPYILCSINWCHGYGSLVVIFVIFHILWTYYVLFKPFIGQKLYDNYLDGMIDKWIEFRSKILVSVVMLITVIVLSLAYLTFECRDDWGKTRGLIGPAAFLTIGFAVSKHHKSIPWRIVVHGMLAQLLLAIFCLRWEFGRSVFQCMGEKVTTFLGYARFGARFVYGDRIVDEYVFAFAILAVVFFFSVVTSILYYLGWMQAFLGVLGSLLQSTVGTTTCESVNAVGNIFLGMSESPLMIRPYINILTVSELHCICVCGYATVAGTVLGAFVSFGANPAYLIAASVMAAPSALAYSKLFYPETEESQTRADNIKLAKSEDTSILDAAASGAQNAMLIVLGIVANIIAFLALVYFFNAVIQWAFELLDISDITLLYLLSKMFWPIAYAMGVPLKDCSVIGLVVAEKSLINEFIGYKHLGELIQANEIEHRSEAIATFALCGFANPGSLGILIAALSAMAPQRRADVTRVAVRAFFAGSFVSFTSASLAGILIKKPIVSNVVSKFMEIDADGDDYVDHHILNV
ncbi:uncharacterized transporter YutK [Drosophila bipectinata]|uniref:uncharacterized transporter YutK n=1 Tax=Drosophila bipectinata TaxID=42026 RepID=UPI0038B376BA